MYIYIYTRVDKARSLNESSPCTLFIVSLLLHSCFSLVFLYNVLQASEIVRAHQSGNNAATLKRENRGTLY